jgi:hypothetical protein
MDHLRCEERGNTILDSPKKRFVSMSAQNLKMLCKYKKVPQNPPVPTNTVCHEESRECGEKSRFLDTDRRRLDIDIDKDTNTYMDMDSFQSHQQFCCYRASSTQQIHRPGHGKFLVAPKNFVATEPLAPNKYTDLDMDNFQSHPRILLLQTL